VTAQGQREEPFSAELAEIVTAWQSLPDAVRAGIVAMVRASRNAVEA